MLYRQHRERYTHALEHLMSLLLMTFGTCTIFHCLLVGEYTTSILFFSYVSSYTAVLLCQVCVPSSSAIEHVDPAFDALD
jgi:hypothetical protein